MMDATRGKGGKRGAPLCCRNSAANEFLSSSGEVCVVCACHWCLHFISFFPIRTTTNKNTERTFALLFDEPCCEPHKQTKVYKNSQIGELLNILYVTLSGLLSFAFRRLRLNSEST